ncbi:MAG: DEAD/DEAH box helicase [Bdellovibrionaceae bacterium]|nr:DEAD/DEAH box helicase [Pseudobdellovibrionaceae bacterium]
MDTFEELSLDPALKRAVSELGFTKPSPIQAQALPILLGPETDFIGLAATGTGKTAAFSLPLLERIDPTVKGVQAVILCPTRELCMQVSGQVNLLGKYKGIQALPIYGGAGYDEQLRGLRKGVSVVVGTPGRTIDHLNRGTLQLDKVKIVVLDEADEMISMGFREDMETILATVPEEGSNTWLFSATMSGPVRKVADAFLTKPKMVQVNRTEMLSSTVEQICYMTQEKNKPEVLCKLIDAADDFYGVIFCQMKSLVVDLTAYLLDRGYKVDCLHGDMSQAARETAMLAFRQKRKKILVCTDVASRGLDVKDITHVVNYSLPRELDSYVHRIGRTARSGKTGIAISLVTPMHRHLLNKIEALTKSRFVEGTVPTRKDIGMKKVAQLLGQFTAVPNAERAMSLMDQTWKDALSTMTAEEVAARFLSMMYPWVFVDSVRPPEMARSTVAPGASAGRPDRRDDRRDDRRKDDRPALKPKFSREERFDRQGDAPRKERAAKFQSFAKSGPAPERFDRPSRNDQYEKSERPPKARWSKPEKEERARSPREERFALGGEKKRAKSDFEKGPFHKFAKGKKKSNGDQPPRRSKI